MMSFNKVKLFFYLFLQVTDNPAYFIVVPKQQSDVVAAVRYWQKNGYIVFVNFVYFSDLPPLITLESQCLELDMSLMTGTQEWSPTVC